MADATDLGSVPKGCGFDSRLVHHAPPNPCRRHTQNDRHRTAMDNRIFDAAFDSLPSAFRGRSPRAALLLGSGWNRAADSLRVLAEVP